MPEKIPHYTNPTVKVLKISPWMRFAFRGLNREKEDDDSQYKFNINVKQLTQETMDTFITHVANVALKHDVAYDEIKYMVHNYEEKLEEVDKRLYEILKALWKDIPVPHLRVEYANVISFIITFAEMYGFVNDTMIIEKSHVTCKVIDKMTEIVRTMQQIRNYGHADMTNFSQILELCDDINEAFQNLYRVEIPLRKKRKPVYPKKCYKFSPYDYEWLCGSVISGPYHLECVKYLCVSSLNQMNLTAFRQDIIAASIGREFSFAANIRVPFPREPTSAKLLNAALIDRERCLRIINHRKLKKLKPLLKTTDRSLRFARDYEAFHSLRGDIRRKKRSLAEGIVKCGNEDASVLYMVIGVLSAVEAHLLMVHKAFSLFVDKEKGMFGPKLPRKIFAVAFQIYTETLAEKHTIHLLDDVLFVLLKTLRTLSRDWIRQAYCFEEEKAEPFHTEDVNVDINNGENYFPYNLKICDFPDELSHHAKQMIEHLYWQENEMKRLHSEVRLAQEGWYGWPVDDEEVPEFTINTCGDKAFSFHCNFSSGLGRIYYRVLRAVDPMPQKLGWDNFTGYEIVRLSHNAIEECGSVPSLSELYQGFLAVFRQAFGEKSVEGMNAQRMAQQFADIVNSDIELCDMRNKLKGHKGKGTVLTTKQVVTEVTSFYLTELRKHSAQERRKTIAPKKSHPSDYDEEEEEDDIDEAELGEISGEGIDVEEKDAGLNVIINQPLNDNEYLVDDEYFTSDSELEAPVQKESKKKKPMCYSSEDAASANKFDAVSLGPINGADLVNVANNLIYWETFSSQCTAVPNHIIDNCLASFRWIVPKDMPDLSKSYYNVD